MKVTKTYSVEKELFDLFDETTNNLNINKSSIIEDKIKEIILDNVQIDTISTWYLKNSTDLIDDPEKLNKIFKKSERLLAERKMDILKKKLQHYATTYSKEEYDFDKLRMDITEMQMILDEDMKKDFNQIKIVDKKIVDNKLYFVLSNDTEVEQKEFYEMFEKCVDMKEFFKPCNIYKCDLIEEKINEIKINDLSETNDNFKQVFLEIEMNLEQEMIFKERKEYVLDFKMNYNRDGLITLNKKINLFFVEGENGKYVFSTLQYYLNENFDLIDGNFYRIKNPDFLVDVSIYDVESKVYLKENNSKIIGDFRIKKYIMVEKEKEKEKDNIGYIKVSKLVDLKSGSNVDLIGGDLFYTNQRDQYDVYSDSNVKMSEILFEGFSILDKFPIFKIKFNDFENIKLEDCFIQKKSLLYYGNNYKIVDFKTTTQEEIK